MAGEVSGSQAAESVNRVLISDYNAGHRSVEPAYVVSGQLQGKGGTYIQRLGAQATHSARCHGNAGLNAEEGFDTPTRPTPSRPGSSANLESLPGWDF